ncbi:MAG: hypothetical protein ABTQ73_09840 [Caldilineales bacterium]
MKILLILLCFLPGLHPLHSAAPVASATSCSDALINGSFEATTTGWAQSSLGGYSLISQFNPRSGSWGAYLGGSNNADDRLSQSLTLPASASAITLRLWWAQESEDALVAHDFLTLSLLRSDGTLLADLWQTDNTATGTAWDEVTLDISRYAGQQVMLRLRATSNSFDLTDFYVDDLSVQVCGADGAQLRSFLPLIWHHQ